MIYDSLKIKGDLVITLTDEIGNVKQHMEVPNLIVTLGKNHIASRIAGTAQTVMTLMQVGSSATTPTLTDTALITEAPTAKVALAGFVATNNQITATATFGPGIGGTSLREAGLFNASSIMLARTTFPLISKASNDTLSITWTITVA